MAMLVEFLDKRQPVEARAPHHQDLHANPPSVEPPKGTTHEGPPVVGYSAQLTSKLPWTG